MPTWPRQYKLYSWKISVKQQSLLALVEQPTDHPNLIPEDVKANKEQKAAVDLLLPKGCGLP